MNDTVFHLIAPGQQLLSCATCGCVVSAESQQKHADWHRYAQFSEEEIEALEGSFPLRMEGRHGK